MLKSPFNYSGSKDSLIPQLKQYFPKDIDKCYDLFCGGCGFSINVLDTFSRIIANDIITPLIRFYKWLQVTSWEHVLEEVAKRNISKDSHEEYLKLRQRFNETKDFIDFFILCSSCTNNMMRFNKSYEFNQTWGKRHFNPSTEARLQGYHKKLYQNPNIHFFNRHFYDITIDSGFVYLDPPYCITEAGYNAYWSNNLEYKLYDFMDDLNHRGVKFVLSGVLEHKGRLNPFKDRMLKYDVITLQMDYNKVAKKKIGATQEVIVKNF